MEITVRGCSQQWVKLEAVSQNPMQEICMSGPSGM